MNNRTDYFSVLDDALNSFRFSGSVFFLPKLAAPWGISLENVNRPRFHISLKGEFVVGLDNSSKSTTINGMDIVIVTLPHGNKHWIADNQKSDRINSSDVAHAHELGTPVFQEGEITNKGICGYIDFDNETFNPILSSLPPILHFSNIEENDPIWITVKLLEAEILKVNDNTDLMVDRLSEVLFLKLMHKHFEESSELSGFFSGLCDKQLNKVLEYIHRKPHHQWTLEILGDHVGMSRATLVRKFNKTLGMPPMQYIKKWRMMKAYQVLKYSMKPVENVAESVGFLNSRTLNRAFQREYGITPNQLRQDLSA